MNKWFTTDRDTATLEISTLGAEPTIAPAVDCLGFSCAKVNPTQDKMKGLKFKVKGGDTAIFYHRLPPLNAISVNGGVQFGPDAKQFQALLNPALAGANPSWAPVDNSDDYLNVNVTGYESHKNDDAAYRFRFTCMEEAAFTVGR